MNAMRKSTKAVLTKKAPVLSAMVGMGVGIVSSVFLIAYEIKETRRSIKLFNIIEEDTGCIETNFGEANTEHEDSFDNIATTINQRTPRK